MVKENVNIVVFTRWFPYNKWHELSFLKDEIEFLNNSFNKVTIVPQKIEGDYYQLSNDIVINEEFAQNLIKIGIIDKLRSLFSLIFILEIFKCKLNISKIRYAFSTRLAAEITKKWVMSFCSKNRSDQNIIFYSFWLDFTSLGILLSKKKHQKKVVARCHNFDLYGNSDNLFYVPFQKYIFQKLDAIYPDSIYGETYILSKFKQVNCKAMLMGVPKAKKINLGSTDENIRIVSCSHLIKRKRVHLILEGLIEFANVYSERNIFWFHVGDGPESIKLKEKLKDVPNNLKVDLKGWLNRNELHKFYLDTPIDLFINVSTKEGTPVSLMEAISYGIPVIATEFGGNKEIIEFGGGLMLTINTNKNEISDTIYKAINKENFLRNSALNTWEKKYNSSLNNKHFCNELFKLYDE